MVSLPDEIVLRLAAATLDHVQEVRAHLALRVALHCAAGTNNRIGPQFEALAVLLWNAQHLGDDNDRQGIGQVVDDIHVAL